MDDVRLHEPEAALRDGRSEAGDGLGYYRTFAAEAARFLEPSGLLGVEVGQGQAGPVTEIFRGRGWRLESIVKDYGGIERVVTVRP